MSNTARHTDLCTGHDCYQSRANDQGSPNVLANGLGNHRQTDHWPVHFCYHDGNQYHDGELLCGSPTVYTNGLQQGRIGDPINCGSTVLTGSPNIHTGDRSSTPLRIVIFQNRRLVFNERDFGNLDDTPEVDDGLLAYPPIFNPTPEEQERYKPIVPDTTNSEKDTTPPPAKETPPTECQDVTDGVSDSFQLSTNFVLGDLSTNAVLSRQRVAANAGLTVQDIVCNLQALAENVLEPLAAKYGRNNMLITSGFRMGSGRSQHERGQAVDVQFPKFNNNQMFAVAQWIRSNIPYDQFILEYGGNRPWLHLSFNRSGNRSASAGNKFGTQIAAGNYVWRELRKVA